MSGYNFTDRVRKVLQMAREEAERLRHEYVGTEHILLGIIREGKGVAAAVLTNLGVDLERVRERIEETTREGKYPSKPGLDLPYTSRAKKILELAMSEARELSHDYVGTEHLLLGVLGEEKGIAAQVLNKAGVILEAARAEVLRLLGTAQFGDSRKTVLAEGDRRFKTAIALIELHHLRFGVYPASLEDLQFVSNQEQSALVGLKYERLADGYALDLQTGVGKRRRLNYPPEFWQGLGIRRTNVAGGPGS